MDDLFHEQIADARIAALRVLEGQPQIDNVDGGRIFGRVVVFTLDLLGLCEWNIVKTSVEIKVTENNQWTFRSHKEVQYSVESYFLSRVFNFLHWARPIGVLFQRF